MAKKLRNPVEVVQYNIDQDQPVSIITERIVLDADKGTNAIRLEDDDECYATKWHIARFVRYDEERDRMVYRILGVFES